RTGIGDARAVTLSPPDASAGGSSPPETSCADVFPNFARSTGVPHPQGVRAQRNRDPVHSLWTTSSTPVDNGTHARRRTREKQKGPQRRGATDPAVPRTPRARRRGVEGA